MPSPLEIFCATIKLIYEHIMSIIYTPEPVIFRYFDAK